MNNIQKLWGKLPVGAKKVFHTFWQVAGGVLLTALISAHSTTDVKGALVVAFTAGLAAVKALLLA